MTFYKRMYQTFKSRKAFTLTEILIAVGIVGVIAALVMPKIITNYQTRAMNLQYSRITQTLSDSLKGLAVSENKVNFGKTSMWVASADSVSYDDTSGAFLKKYLAVSKYIGDGASSSTAKDAFADEYYSYDNADGTSTEGKSRIEITPDISGACAILKNGASICLKPQIGSQPAQGIIDLNGKKGPNILNRDYRELKLNAVEFSDAEMNLIAGSNVSEVITEDHENLVPDEENPCGVDDYSAECCLYKAEKGAITGPDHQCCANPSVASQISACASDITMNFNMYPSTCNLNYATAFNPKCSKKPYATGSGSTATQNGKTITSLPAAPPNVYLFCDGINVGYMTGSNVKSLMESSSSQSIFFTITYPTCSGMITCGLRGIGNPTCGYQTGEGLKSSRSSVVFTTSGAYQNYKYNNIMWSVKYH